MAAKSAPSPLSFLRIIAATMNETIAAPRTPTMLPKYEPFAETSKIAKIEPGEAAAFNPPLRVVNNAVPVTPPQIAAMIKDGFINTYGK